MKHAAILAIALLCGIYSASFGQNKKGFQIGYFGSLITHPGIKIGYERTMLASRPKSETKIRKYIAQLILSPHIGTYYHHQNNLSVFTGLDFAYRHIYRKGLMIEFVLGTAYLRTFLYGTTYSVDLEGQVNKVAFAGINNLMNTVQIGLGYRFKNNTIWFIRPGGHLRSRINTYHILNISLNTGFILKIK